MASRKIDMIFERALPALVFAFILALMLGCTEDKRNKDVVVAAPAPGAPTPVDPAVNGGPADPGGRVGLGGHYEDAWWDGHQLPQLGCDNRQCNRNVGQLIMHGRRGPRGCSAVLIAPQVAATASRCLNDFDMESRRGLNRRCAVQFAGEFVTCRRIVNGRSHVQGVNADLTLLALDRAPQAQSFIQIASGRDVFEAFQSGGVFRIFGISRANGMRTLVYRECAGVPTNMIRSGRHQHFETMEFHNCPVERTFLGGAVTTSSGQLVGIITGVSDMRAMDSRRGAGAFQVTRLFPPRWERQDRRSSRFTLEWRDWQIEFDLDQSR